MKRKILILLFLFAVTLSGIYAQKRFHIGLQTGIVFANVAPTIKYDAKNQWIINNATNGYLSYELTPKFTLTAEPGYLAKNGYERTLTYIQLPVIAEYTVINNLKATIGPEFNFLLNNPDKVYNSPEIAGQIGAYYQASPTFDIGAKFSRSFTKLYNDIMTFSDSQGQIIPNLNFYPYHVLIFTRYKF